MLTNNLVYIKKLLVFDELLSTNDHALSLEKAGEPSGTLIIAQKQSKGRGRLGRTWFMSEGDIAMSLLLRAPYLPQDYLPLISWILALAAIEALKEFSINAHLKWPNDIVIDSGFHAHHDYCGAFEKVGGVLVENIFKEQKLVASILGLGLNIVAKPMLKKEISHITWLRRFVPNLKAEDVLPVLLKKIDDNIYKFLSPEGKVDAHERYLKHCVSVGQRVSILVGEEQIIGQALSLNADGFLIVFDGQKEHIIYSGEVNFSR